jgi:hypothetical protein
MKLEKYIKLFNGLIDLVIKCHTARNVELLYLL